MSTTIFNGDLTGNTATATKLATARAINGVSFDGTAPITVTAAAGTLTGSTLASGVTASSLTSVGILTSLSVSGNLSLGQELALAGDFGATTPSGNGQAFMGTQMTLGLILNGKGSLSDARFFNGAGTRWLDLPTGTISPIFAGNITASVFIPSGAAGIAPGIPGMWYDATAGLVINTVVGSAGELLIQNSTGAHTISIPTGTSNVVFSGTLGLNGSGASSGASISFDTLPLYSNSVGVNGFMMNSSGAHYGGMGNVGSDEWALGYASAPNTLVTPVIQWSTAGVSVAGTLEVTSNLTVDNNAAVGTTISGSTVLNIRGAGTGFSSVRIQSGTAPTSPVDGDMWYDGTNLKFRVGGTTKTII